MDYIDPETGRSSIPHLWEKPITLTLGYTDSKGIFQKKGVLTMGNQLTKDEFVLKAVKELRVKPYKGIHSVYSGHNSAFKEYFGEDSDPIAHTRAMQKAKKLVIIPAKGGVMLYDAKDAPSSGSGKATLAKMGL